MSDKFFIKSATSFEYDDALDQYTCVKLYVDDDSCVSAGTGDRILEADCPWATQEAAQNVLDLLSDFKYQPYTSSGVVLNPAAELGDGVTISGIYSGIYDLETEYTSLCTSTISAAYDEDIDHEYPYETSSTRASKRTKAALENEITTSFTIANGLIESEVAERIANTPTVNLLPSVYTGESTSNPNTVTTSDGANLTFTVNSDGSVTVNGVGRQAASSYVQWWICGLSPSANVPAVKLEPGKKYFISGCPSDAGGKQYDISVYMRTSENAGGAGGGADTGSGRAFDVFDAAPYAGIAIVIYPYANLNNVTFYPMLNVGDTALEYTSTHGGSYAMSSKISQQADEISAKVSQTGNNSDKSFSWSLTADGFTLKSGSTSVFKCDKSGLTVNGGGTFSGTLSAATFSGGTITIGSSGQFNVDSSGNLTANNATLTGTLTLGDATISANSLRSYASNAYTSACTTSGYAYGGGTFGANCYNSSYAATAIKCNYLCMGSYYCTIQTVTIGSSKYAIPCVPLGGG